MRWLREWRWRRYLARNPYQIAPLPPDADLAYRLLWGSVVMLAAERIKRPIREYGNMSWVEPR